MVELRERNAMDARALQFTILTGVRTSEATGATWDKVAPVTKGWIIPENRMKGGREHRVHYLLRQLRSGTVARTILFFPANSRDHLFNMALMLLRRMRRDDLTAHGFCASCKTRASEQTRCKREI